MIEILRTRRSIRSFTPEKVAAYTIEALIEAALRSPTSRGINPWEFIFVDDPAILSKLALAKQHGSEFIKNAPLAIVVCADSTKSDVWIEDCSIAAIILQLTAQLRGSAAVGHKYATASTIMKRPLKAMCKNYWDYRIISR
jgi:nitroreductase